MLNFFQSGSSRASYHMEKLPNWGFSFFVFLQIKKSRCKFVASYMLSEGVSFSFLSQTQRQIEICGFEANVCHPARKCLGSQFFLIVGSIFRMIALLLNNLLVTSRSWRTACRKCVRTFQKPSSASRQSTLKCRVWRPMLKSSGRGLTTARNCWSPTASKTTRTLRKNGYKSTG